MLIIPFKNRKTKSKVNNIYGYISSIDVFYWDFLH